VFRRLPRTDDADGITPLGEHYEQQTPTKGLADQQKAFLVVGVLQIRAFQHEGIGEYGLCLTKRDAMFETVLGRLLRIVLEEKA
jgi:hypothetical protein